MKNISQREYLSIDVPVVSLPEQRQIAEILTTVDELIEKTEALIAKYESIKQGMMHDLFTRGILSEEEARDLPGYEAGMLRPPPEALPGDVSGEATWAKTEATWAKTGPHLYKDSPLGPIPKTWEVKRLEELLRDIPNAMRSGPFGSALLKSELEESGIPLLGIDNVHPEHFREEYHRFVSPVKYAELAKFTVRPDDVMITIMGTVGRCCVVPKGICRALSSKHVWTMTLDDAMCFPVLVCWQLNSAPWVMAQFRGTTQGAVMDAISSRTLRDLLLPCPPIGEQASFRKRYHSVQNFLASGGRQLSKMVRLKQSLMQGLLDGSVRTRRKLRGEPTDGNT